MTSEVLIFYIAYGCANMSLMMMVGLDRSAANRVMQGAFEFVVV